MAFRQALPLDHLVINAHFETDAAARLLSSLGFSLTPKGRHPMGSVNHLMVFQDDYLELIGLPTDGSSVREEILNSPIGVDGLVFKVGSADRVHADLETRGEAVLPLHAFSRPVELDGQVYEARFRTVRFAPGGFSAGRVYFCEHLTPELVWRVPWQSHDNTVTSLAGLLVVSRQPAHDAERYAMAARAGVEGPGRHGELFIRGARYTIIVTSPGDYVRRYGDLVCDALGRSSFFGAIALRIRDPKALLAPLKVVNEHVRHRAASGHIAVKLTGFNALLDFIDDNDNF